MQRNYKINQFYMKNIHAIYELKVSQSYVYYYIIVVVFTTTIIKVY